MSSGPAAHHHHRAAPDRHTLLLQVLEQIMFRYVDLCVELKKGRYAKDGLIHYRNVCQQVNVSSLEEVIKYFLKTATNKAEAAQSKAAEVRSSRFYLIDASCCSSEGHSSVCTCCFCSLIAGAPGMYVSPCCTGSMAFFFICRVFFLQPAGAVLSALHRPWCTLTWRTWRLMPLQRTSCSAMSAERRARWITWLHCLLHSACQLLQGFGWCIVLL